MWDSTWRRSVNAADCVDSVGSCGWCWVWLMRGSLVVAACRSALPLVHLCQRWDGAVVGGHGLAGFLYCFFSLVSCLVWLSLTMVSHRCGYFLFIFYIMVAERQSVSIGSPSIILYGLQKWLFSKPWRLWYLLYYRRGLSLGYFFLSTVWVSLIVLASHTIFVEFWSLGHVLRLQYLLSLACVFWWRLLVCT